MPLNFCNKSKYSTHNAVVLYAALILLTAGPIIRGGNRQVALIFLVGVGLVLISSTLADAFSSSTSNTSRQRATRTDRRDQPTAMCAIFFVLLTSPAWISLIQWMVKSHNSDKNSFVQLIMDGKFNSLASNLDALFASALASIPIIAGAIAGYTLTHYSLRIALLATVASMFIQTAISVFQVADGSTSILYFRTNYYSPFIGTFNNRNHLASYFSLIIPMWAYFITRRTNPGFGAGPFDSKRRIMLPLSVAGACAVAIVLFGGQSRAGLAACALSGMLSTLVWMVTSDAGSKGHRFIVFVASALLLTLLAAMAFGTEYLVQRFAPNVLSTDVAVRNGYTHLALIAASEYWPVGSGLGSFESTFPRFQTVDMGGLVSHAHNDYAQFLMEAGIFAIAFMGLFFAIVVHQLARIRQWCILNPSQRSTVALHLYCGAGFLPVIIHSRFDFVLHIPAIAITTAFAIGVFFRPVRKAEN